MKTENAVLMAQAKESLKGKWGIAVGTFFAYFVISGAIQNIPNAGPILGFLVAGPLTLGINLFSLSLSRGQNPHFDQLFQGFKRFGQTLQTYLLLVLFILLWTLLLIIPGIIAALSYSQTFYLLVDEPNLSPREAIRKSKKMMDGYKWKLFKLHLRFVGWFLLAILTIGIGFLWLIPYVQVSLAKFYEDLKTSQPQEGETQPA